MSICIPMQDLFLKEILVYSALLDCFQGETSKTIAPLHVIKYKNKYVLVDGYHRLIEFMLFWRGSVICEVIDEVDSPQSISNYIDGSEFKCDDTLRFFGLEKLMDNECLEDISCNLKK